MFVDRMCLGPSQDVCVRAPPRSSSASVRPRRSMSHGGRRCSSIAGAARRGITRTVEGRLRASSPRSSSAAVRPPRSMSHGGRRCSSIVGAVPRGHYSDRRWTAACELPAILIGRSPTTALDVPRGPSMFVDRRCGITRTVDRPQLGLAAGGLSMFAVSVRRVSRAALDTFVGDATCRTSACELTSDPHRPQSDRGARCPTGAVDVRRSQVRHHSDRRSTAARPRSTGGSAMFAVSVRRVSRAALDTFVGDATCRTSACELPAILIGRSPTAARCPTGVVDVRRSQVLRGAASLGPSLDRSTDHKRRVVDVCGDGSRRLGQVLVL